MSRAPGEGGVPLIGRAGRTAAGRSPPSPTPPPRPSRRPWPALLLALVIIVAAAAVEYVRWALSPPAATPAAVVFEVPRGSSARSVAARLQEDGLVRDARVFLALLMWQGLDRRVGEGLYTLDRSMGASEVAAALARGGRPRTVSVVIPEGSRLADVAARLERVGLATQSDALAAAQEAPAPGRPDTVGLEGYLFPAVYEVPVGEAPERTLARMVERFERELDDDTRARVAAAGLDVHGWVTLASIVQSEAAGDHEMPLIAGVFLNRLDLGMPLQSDPTVAYGLGKDLPALDFPGGDFSIDHPWNTYTRSGLPAGPIGNPGRAALEAVLAPERLTPDGRRWLYFLHGRSEAGPVFRPNVDLEGHIRDVNRFLR